MARPPRPPDPQTRLSGDAQTVKVTDDEEEEEEEEEGGGGGDDNDDEDDR